jgi:hypothetical protein
VSKDRSGQPDAGDWQGVGDYCQPVLQIFAQTWNFGPEGSMVRGSDMIAAEMEEVVDLIVG